MSLWLKTLKATAEGDRDRADRLLNTDLGLAICARQTPSGIWQYQGVLPERVQQFVRKLPGARREFALPRQDELTDYIFDQLYAAIERTVFLVELCVTFPATSIETMVEDFAHWKGLRRNPAEKRKYITDNLRSMIARDVSLPNEVHTILGEEGEARYDFDEMKLARKWDVARSWREFQIKNELTAKYLCLDEGDEEREPEVAEEGYDYGLIKMSEVVAQMVKPTNQFNLIEMSELSVAVKNEIEGCLEEFHRSKPLKGYRPIAWHNVFWNLEDKYSGLALRLKRLQPHLRTDENLARFVKAKHAEVENPSRRNIARRRKDLGHECETRTQEQAFKMGFKEKKKAE